MQLFQYGALVGLLGYAVEASPALHHEGLAVRSEKEIQTFGESCSSDLTKSWADEVLYSGMVQAATDEVDAVQLGLALPEGAFAGSVDLSCANDFLLAPTVRVDLGGVKAYLKVALDVTAGVSESFNLFTDLDLSLAVPGLAAVDVQVGVALDLVFTVSAALDLETIFDVQFPDGCYVDINLLTNEIVDSDLTSLAVQSLPQSVGALVSLEEDVVLDVALRLRTGLLMPSEVDITGLDLGAGAEAALWINLFDYTTTISKGSSGSDCSSQESISLTAGVAVEVDVEIEELELTLAPAVIVTLSTAPAELVTVTIGDGSSYQWSWGSGSSSSSGSGSGSSSSGSSGSGRSSGSSGSAGGSAAISNGTIGASPATAPLPSGMTTSTVYETSTYTITSCAASVKNCPATYTQQVVTAVVNSYTTICPVTATETQGASTQQGSAGVPSVATPTATLAQPSDIGGPSQTPGAAATGENAPVGAPKSQPPSATTTPAPGAPAPSSPASGGPVPSASRAVTLTPCPTPSTSTQLIPGTVVPPPPTVVMPGPTAAPAAGSSSTVHPTGAGPAAVPSGVAAPSGVFAPRPHNGTARPTGPGVPVPYGGTSQASDAAAGAAPTSIVTAGAGNVGLGMAAAFAPLLIAMM